MMGKIPMLKMSLRRTRLRNSGKLGKRRVSFSTSTVTLANFTGGLPATVVGWPNRERICRRNRTSLAGVETPKRKLLGNCPCSTTQLLPLKKFRGKSSLRSVRCLAPQSSMLVKHPLDQNTWESAAARSGTRLNMRSHSEAPKRGKRMPASARRY